MNLSEIKNELQQVLQLVEEWHEKGVNDLERDLALGKLRKIYSSVRFESTPQPESIDAEEKVSTVAVVENEPESLNVGFAEELPVGISISLDDVLGSLVTEDLMPEVAPFAEPESLFEPEAEVEPTTEEVAPLAEVVEEEDRPLAEEIIPAEPELSAVEEPTAEVAAEVEPELPAIEEVAEVEPELPAIEEVAEAEPEPTPEPVAPTIAEPSLFGDELFAPRPSRRTRMMSLYDDEPSVTVVTPKAKSVEPVAQPVIEDKPAPSPIVSPIPEVEPATNVEPIVASEPEVEEEFVEVDVDSQPAQEPVQELAAEPLMPEENEPTTIIAPAEPKRVVTVAQEAPSQPVIEQTTYVEPQVEVAVTKSATSVVPESEQVLGEVLKSDVRTIADIITPKSTTVEQIAKGAISDINKAVGVNDRYLLIRDLFGGSAEEYERVVAVLNNFENLEDCMIYIDEHFDWNPNSDGAKMMMELLERKYC